MAYAAVRLAEGYGLWFGRRWASWLGVVGGGLYVPVEIYELARHPDLPKSAVLAINLAIVALLGRQLRHQEGAAPDGTPRP